MKTKEIRSLSSENNGKIRTQNRSKISSHFNNNSERKYNLNQGWAINFYQGPNKKPELCQRATNILPL